MCQAIKLLVKEGLLETLVIPKKGHEEREEKEKVCGERKIDLEIEEFSKEIWWKRLKKL